MCGLILMCRLVEKQASFSVFLESDMNDHAAKLWRIAGCTGATARECNGESPGTLSFWLATGRAPGAFADAARNDDWASIK